MQQADAISSGRTGHCDCRETAIDDGARRVMVVIESTIGGTRLNLRILVTEMIGRGKTVALAYSARRERDFLEDIAQFRALGVECVEVPMRRAPEPFSDIRAIISLRRLLREFRPDTLHLISSKAGLIGRLAAIGTGVTVQYAPHCFAFKSDSPMRSIYATVERFLAPLTDRLVAVCHSEADDARRIGYADSKIWIVPNRLPDGYAPKMHPAANGARPVAAFIGRCARQKGVDILLDAYRLLGGNEGCGFDLVVMSDLKPRMKQAFEALGATVSPYGTHDEAMGLLSRCDMLLMPSRWEAAPYLLLEALAAGVFVVAHDVGGVREIVGGEERGLLYSGGDADALAAALKTVRQTWRTA